MQVTVQSNSLYYNMLYVNTQLHSKKRVKHYFGEKCILGGVKYTISYIKVMKKRCVSVQVPATLFVIGSYRAHMQHSVNIIHL